MQPVTRWIRLAPILLLAAIAVVHSPSLLEAQGRGAPPVAAPRVQPWTPPGFDSLLTWSATARAQFREQPRDEIDSVTVVPYNRVASIALRYLRALGRANMKQAGAVETALDSLGFDTDLVTDPLLPSFAALVIRNPFKVSAHAMAFMFWFRGDRLSEQGMELLGGGPPLMRVWYNNHKDAPYEWAFVDRPRGAGPMRFYLFRLTADGGFWRPGQYEGNGPDLGEALDASFADVNGDGIPELTTWLEAAPDTLFEPCGGCPKRLIERVYTERKFEGFALHDSRVVPTTHSIFVLFIHMLIDKNRAGAARLLADPAKLDQAFGLGWGTRTAPGTWKLEQWEDDRWPNWLTFRFRGTRGNERYVFRFTQKDGRWIIKEWERVKPAQTSK